MNSRSPSPEQRTPQRTVKKAKRIYNVDAEDSADDDYIPDDIPETMEDELDDLEGLDDDVEEYDDEEIMDDIGSYDSSRAGSYNSSRSSSRYVFQNFKTCQKRIIEF